MREIYIKFKTAKLAKKRGFNLEYNGYQLFYITDKEDKEYIVDYPRHTPFEHHTYILAPTQTLLQSWLREIHKIEVSSKLITSLYRKLYEKGYKKKCLNYSWTIITGIDDENHFYEEFNSDNTYTSYEEALENALYNALKLIN